MRIPGPKVETFRVTWTTERGEQKLEHEVIVTARVKPLGQGEQAEVLRLAKVSYEDFTTGGPGGTIGLLAVANAACLELLSVNRDGQPVPIEGPDGAPTTLAVAKGALIDGLPGLALQLYVRSSEMARELLDERGN